MKSLIILVATILICNQLNNVDATVQNRLGPFKKTCCNKRKNEREVQFQLKMSQENKHKIDNGCFCKERDGHGFRQGLNFYADTLEHEFAMNLFQFNSIPNLAESEEITYLSPSNVDIPESFDWRDYGAVTHVKWQAYCGASWAFAATGALEGQHFRKTGELVELSEQNLIDCSSKYGNKGCEGGRAENAYLYIKQNHGIDTEKSYPTELDIDMPHKTCYYNSKNKAADVKGYVRLPSENEEKLKEAVATVGPIAVAIDASLQSFLFYKSGVYFDNNCSSTDLNSAGLVVGYGRLGEEDYWMLKWSMTGFYGDGGYIKMARNRNNSCGIATSPTYPLV